MSVFSWGKPEYRADIDGLRALAILSVLFFHSQIGIGNGGYVGVDVFFVISGYLITQILLYQASGGVYNLLSFYSRRAKRIIPALLVMASVTTAAAYFLLMPGELKAFGHSLVAAIGFYSNFSFHSQSGYFDAPSLTKPLLHTWSLAVEAQFYLIFPLFLLVLRIAKKKWIVAAAIVIVFALSLSFSILSLRSNPSAAFYMLSSRAWELLAGAILALGVIPRTSSARICVLAQIVGALCIAWPMFFYTPNTPFPGEYALLPVLGAALIIWSGKSRYAPVSNILERRSMVLLGRISYSLYLWHWPLLVLTRQVIGHRPDIVTTIGVLLAAVFLSILTYNYVERPCIAWTGRRSTRMALAGSGVFMILGLAIAGMLYDKSEGLPSRLTEEALILNAGSKDIAPEVERCHTVKTERVINDDLCGLGDPLQQPSFVVWGDSHAHALYGAFNQTALKYKVSGRHASYRACPPLLDVGTVTDIGEECRQFNEAMIVYINKHQFNNVFLVARWAVYVSGYTPEGPENGMAPLLSERRQNSKLTSTSVKSDVLFARGLENTIRRLSQPGRKIYVLDQAPEATHHVPSSLARSKLIYSWNASQLKPRRAEVEIRQQFISATLADMQRRYAIQVLHTRDFLCGLDTCEIEHAGRSLYRDGDHLSSYGASYLRPMLEPAFQQIASISAIKN